MIMSRCVRLDEVMKVSRLGRADDFVSQGGNFEDYSCYPVSKADMLPRLPIPCANQLTSPMGYPLTLAYELPRQPIRSL